MTLTPCLTDTLQIPISLSLSLLGGLVDEGIFVQPVGDVAVEGARLHGHAIHSSERPVCNIEGFQHSEAWRR